MRDDELWAPPSDVAPPADPPGASPRYPDEVVWLPDPVAHARAAALAAWLESRFPDGGTLEQRDSRNRRRARVFTWCGCAAAVAVIAALVVYGFPDAPSPSRHPAWPWAVGALAVMSVVFAVALLLATRRRPAVSAREREVLEGVTIAERRELRADLRSSKAADAEQVDAVAAAWLAGRANLLNPARVVLPILWLISWEPGPWTLLALALAALGVRDLSDDLKDLLAARDRVRRRGLQVTSPATAVR